MDNLTHSLTGLMFSRAGLNRFHPRASLVLMLAANAPDIDVVGWFGGLPAYVQYHRGLTHAIAFLPVLAALPVILVGLFGRAWAGWRAAYLLSLIGIASHLFLDWTNTYAIRLLLPFSGEWLHLDWLFVFDIWVWAVLLLAVIGPLLGRLVSSEIGAKPGSGRGLAIFALLFFTAYGFGRSLLHQRAIDTLNSRIYRGLPPISAAAFPGPFNPLRWTGWIETDRFSTRFDVNLAGEFDPTAGTTFYKPDPTPAIEAARRSEAFQRFLRFCIYPVWSVTPATEPEGATLVRIEDKRFGFGVSAVVDKSDRVLQSSTHVGR